MVGFDSSSQVTIVMFSKSSWEDSIESLGVGLDPGLDGREVAKSRVMDNSHMLSLG